MRSDKHGLQNKAVILVSAALVALTVGGGVTYLKYQEKANMLKQAEELIVDAEVLPKAYLEAQKDLLSNWKFKHCTSTNGDCGRLE